MTIETLRDKFVYDLEMMYYVENRLVETLADLSTDAANDDLEAAVERHLEQTRDHVSRLEEVFGIIDEPVQERESQVFDALLAEREQFMEEAATDDDLRDLYDLGAAVKNEHVEIAGYEGLIQTARKLELNDDVTDLLESNLDDEQMAKKQLKALGEDSTVRKVFARLAG